MTKRKYVLLLQINLTVFVRHQKLYRNKKIKIITITVITITKIIIINIKAICKRNKHKLIVIIDNYSSKATIISVESRIYKKI